jgi:hypothetical protein
MVVDPKLCSSDADPNLKFHNKDEARENAFARKWVYLESGPKPTFLGSKLANMYKLFHARKTYVQNDYSRSESSPTKRFRIRPIRVHHPKKIKRSKRDVIHFFSYSFLQIKKGKSLLVCSIL